MQAASESGNDEKKNEGNSSSVGLDRLGMHAPKCIRGEEQRVRVFGPGSPFFSSLV
jgi:hypothetical protein